MIYYFSACEYGSFHSEEGHVEEELYSGMNISPDRMYCMKIDLSDVQL